MNNPLTIDPRRRGSLRRRPTLTGATPRRPTPTMMGRSRIAVQLPQETRSAAGLTLRGARPRPSSPCVAARRRRSRFARASVEETTNRLEGAGIYCSKSSLLDALEVHGVQTGTRPRPRRRGIGACWALGAGPAFAPGQGTGRADGAKVHSEQSLLVP